MTELNNGNGVEDEALRIAKRMVVTGLAQKAVKQAIHLARKDYPDLTDESAGSFVERIPHLRAGSKRNGNTEYIADLVHEAGASHVYVGELASDGTTTPFEGFTEEDVLNAADIINNTETN